MNITIKVTLILVLLTLLNIFALEIIHKETFDAAKKDLAEDSPEVTMTEQDNEGIEHSLDIPTEDQIIEYVDYCTIPKCEKVKHIACNNTRQWGSRCPKKVRLIDIQLYKNTILKWHNKQRNDFATGIMKILPSLQIYELQWDEELAYLAKLFVIGCNSYDQHCHISKTFSRTGINIGSLSYNGYTTDISDRQLLKTEILSWFRNWYNNTVKLMNIYRKENHFGTTQLLFADQNTHIGCAAMTWERPFGHKFLIACIYGYNEFHKSSTNKQDNEGNLLLDCNMGKSMKYSHLCRTEGPFEVEPFWLYDDLMENTNRFI